MNTNGSCTLSTQWTPVLEMAVDFVENSRDLSSGGDIVKNWSCMLSFSVVHVLYTLHKYLYFP